MAPESPPDDPTTEKPSSEDLKRLFEERLSPFIHGTDRYERLINDRGQIARVVQEDFITNELIALAKAHGLYEEYKQIFEDLKAYREIQFALYWHVSRYKEPSDIVEPKIDNVRLCAEHFIEKFGRKPVLASLGCGNAIVERTLTNMNLVEEIFAVDVDEDTSENKRFNEEKFSITVIGTKDKSDQEIEDDNFSNIPQADIFFLGDSLHHTHSPFKYLKRVIEKVKPGGYIVVSEPFCFREDALTRENLFPLDSTVHPESMLPLEIHEVWINWLIFKGYKVFSAKMAPGTEAGLNDVYHRIMVIIEKPPEEEVTLPAVLPDQDKFDWEASADELGIEIFEIWPLSLLSKKEQKILLDHLALIANLTLEKLQKMPLKYVKGAIAHGLLSQEPLSEDEKEELIYNSAPFSGFIHALPQYFGPDEELEERNKKASEIFLLVGLIDMEFEWNLIRRIDKEWEPQKWTFREHCPRFHEFIDPTLAPRNDIPKIKFPKELTQKDYLEICTRLIDLFHEGKLLKVMPPLLIEKMGEERAKAHYIGALITKFCERAIKSEKRTSENENWILDLSKNPLETKDLLSQLKGFIKALKYLNRSDKNPNQVLLYTVELIQNIFRKRGTAPPNIGEARLLKPVAELAQEGQPLLMIAAIAKATLNDIIVSLSQHYPLDVAQKIIDEEVAPIVLFIREKLGL